ncbi:NnrU family protein [Sphingomonas soli]|uniref:NnrU family protein n=1 Tax=Sphingomonas soli TaxID=266127 RepID=UPI00082D6917|nr:NnrU family protein [Sphingomonas soli]
MESLIAAAIAFVGLHFLLSHPLRRPLVERIGEGPFLGLYSVAALATLAWMAFAYRAAPPELLWWNLDGWGWAIASAAMAIGSVLFAGSLFGNPAFPNPKAGGHEAIGNASGVYAITRHPMMWGFAIWSLVHFAAFPTSAHLVLTAAILILALVGAALQDAKKTTLVPAWRDWKARTSYLPFAAQIADRAPWSAGGTRAILGGLILWLAASWAHEPLGGAFAAGVWRWLG